MTVINLHTHVAASFLSLSRPQYSYRARSTWTLLKALSCVCVCASWHADPSHRLLLFLNSPISLETKQKASGRFQSTRHTHRGSEIKKKNRLEWQSTFDQSCWNKWLSTSASHAFEIPPSSFLQNTQVTLIGSQQSTDNQQHDFDDRPFFFSLSSMRLEALSFDRRGPDCAKMAEHVIALLYFFSPTRGFS